jgi:hypothetical protein
MKRILLTAAALALACSPTPIDVGSYSIANSEDSSGWTREEACVFGAQLDIVGTWKGTRPDQRTPSGSDAVELVISHANASRVCGTLTFGSGGPTWPTTIDPDRGYPPDISNNVQSSFEAYIASLEGVPLTITAGHVAFPQISFRASYAQWREWCALQTPYPCEGVPSAEYYCVPTSGPGGLSPRVRYMEGVGCVTDYGGGTHVIDCGKATLCLGGPCTCTAARCTAPPFWGSGYELYFQSDTAVGSGMALRRAP